MYIIHPLTLFHHILQFARTRSRRNKSKANHYFFLGLFFKKEKNPTQRPTTIYSLQFICTLCYEGKKYGKYDYFRDYFYANSTSNHCPVSFVHQNSMKKIMKMEKYILFSIFVGIPRVRTIPPPFSSTRIPFERQQGRRIISLSCERETNQITYQDTLIFCSLVHRYKKKSSGKINFFFIINARRNSYSATAYLFLFIRFYSTPL